MSRWSKRTRRNRASSAPTTRRTLFSPIPSSSISAPSSQAWRDRSDHKIASRCRSRRPCIAKPSMPTWPNSARRRRRRRLATRRTLRRNPRSRRAPSSSPTPRNRRMARRSNTMGRPSRCDTARWSSPQSRAARTRRTHRSCSRRDFWRARLCEWYSKRTRG